MKGRCKSRVIDGGAGLRGIHPLSIPPSRQDSMQYSCHTAMEYSIGKTRVLSNPKGYPHEHGNGFDPLKTLEIAEKGISAL